MHSFEKMVLRVRSDAPSY